MSKHDPTKWDRRLWGVLFWGAHPDDPPMLIAAAWEPGANTPRYDGEPAWPLLFDTRQQARDWCRERNSEWQRRKDFVAKCVLRPVRVREIVWPEIPLNESLLPKESGQ